MTSEPVLLSYSDNERSEVVREPSEPRRASEPRTVSSEKAGVFRQRIAPKESSPELAHSLARSPESGNGREITGRRGNQDYTFPESR